MKKLKGNLHTHTIFSDGDKSPEELITIYKSLDYDFIAITDHDFLVSDDHFSKLPSGDGDFIVFKGIEISEEFLAGMHVSLILGDNERLYIINHPSLYSLSIKNILTEIEILKSKYKVDCIDVSHYGTYMPEYDTELIPLPKIVSDDAHRDGMFGNAWIEVEALMDKDDIIKNIKKGNFTTHFK